VCTALLHAVLFAGAKPVLADVDDRTGLINVDTVQKVLTKKAKAVIAPHLFGAVCDARSIEDLGVPVIEDCAQCFGVKHGNNLVGSQTAISVFSLYATKLTAAGEGGLVATSDSSLYKKIIRLREYDNRETFAPAFNFKLSDVHASIARAQLAQLGMFIKARRTIAAWYKKELAFVKGISLPAENVMGESVWFRYVISVKNAPKMIHELQEQGIGAARPIFKPLHRYLQLDGFKATDEMQKKSVSIPLYPDLTLADCHRIVSAIKLVQ
jgi:dTDP-4-amino-4,6-dideoxygalactose transaminase